MLGIVGPLSNVFVAIREDHRPLAISLATSKIAFIHPSIRKCQLTLSIKQIIHELACICSLRLSKVVHA